MRILIGFLMSLALFPASTVYATDERPVLDAGVFQLLYDLRAELTECSGRVTEQQQQINDLQKEIDDLKSVIVVCICEIKDDGLIIDRLVRGEGMSERGAHGQALARCEQVVGNPHSCINEKTGKPIVLIKLPKSG